MYIYHYIAYYVVLLMGGGDGLKAISSIIVDLVPLLHYVNIHTSL